MLVNAWIGVVLLGVAVTFAYPLWKGWVTRTVWFPLSILSLQDFEHEQSPLNFWGVMIADLLGFMASLTAAAVVLGSALLTSPQPVASLRSLDGCYEGEGMPDFMRPPVHWTLRLDNGAISNRGGEIVSRLILEAGTSTKTAVRFSPGILLSTTKNNGPSAYAGDPDASQPFLRGAVAGEASMRGGRATIRMTNESDEVLLKTSCG
ncbi:MAG TPA: hypothetical protein VGC56_12185 [Allosphingosinicella sp.]|jgi:hypothetical protein